jgi:hypothetical protein
MSIARTRIPLMSRFFSSSEFHMDSKGKFQLSLWPYIPSPNFHFQVIHPHPTFPSKPEQFFQVRAQTKFQKYPKTHLTCVGCFLATYQLNIQKQQNMASRNNTSSSLARNICHLIIQGIALPLASLFSFCSIQISPSHHHSAPLSVSLPFSPPTKCKQAINTTQYANANAALIYPPFESHHKPTALLTLPLISSHPHVS